MGDSYNGVKIVGTTSVFLDSKELKTGEMFEDKFEAVIGYNVAKRYGLEIGSKIVTSHGLSEGGHSHEANPLVITGILKETKTAYDNVIFTSIHTVWATHHHEGSEEHEHGEVCAILLKTKSFNYYNAVKQQYSESGNLLVINPAEVLREVLENVDMSSQIVYIMCVIILIMNIFIISVITLLNMYDSKGEISLMRLIGISMKKINLIYIIQNGIIGLASTILAFLS